MGRPMVFTATIKTIVNADIVDIIVEIGTFTSFLAGQFGLGVIAFE